MRAPGPLILRAFGSPLPRWPLAFAAIAAAAGALLTRLPLLGVPGYELATAMTLLSVPLALAAGVAAARREQASRSRAPGAAVRSAWAASVLLGLVVLALVFVLAAATSAVRGCSPWTGALFYLLLPVPSVLIASAVGAAIGFGTRRTRAALGLALAVPLVSLLISLWPLYSGPQVFALDPFFGYFPGPLYDEALAVDARLWAHRGLTLLWTALVLTTTAGLLDEKTLRPGRWRGGPSLLAAGLTLAVAVASIRGFAHELGLRTSAGDLEKALATRETSHFVLHLPKAKTPHEAALLERDLEFAWDRVTAMLGAAPGAKVHAYFHETPELKHRRVGAADTSFAKPWRLEFHVHDQPFPHPVARHELAHVVAAAFGSPLLKVSARYLVAVNIGLVEGLAVAADERSDELTLHEWAAAMRRLKLAPDVRDIVGPTGFYRQPQARAYTLVGSFLRFLWERHGSEGLRRLYPGGDFELAYGRPLDALARDWESFLDALPLAERQLHVAEVRFERPSLFERPCAREVALLRERADDLVAEAPEEALALYRRCAEVEPKNVAHARAVAALLRERERLDESRRALEELLRVPGLSTGSRAQTLLELGDLEWERGDTDAARAHFSQALALHRDRAADRSLLARLEGLGAPPIAGALRRYFAARGAGPETVELERLAVERPGDALLRYLVGRQLLQRGSPELARPRLEAAWQLGLPAAELRAEALRLLVSASHQSGDCRGARVAAAALETDGTAADRAFARDWLARCDFEDRVYGGPLPPPRAGAELR